MRPVQKKQSDSILIWDSYSEGFNKKRIFFEFIFPVILAFITLSIYLFTYTSSTDLLINLKHINSDFFAIIAIQIGFNVTALALISAFNKEAIKGVFSKIKEINEKEKALKQLLSSFIYCIFIQTGIIVIGFFYNINIEELIKIDIIDLNQLLKKVILFTPFSLWIGIIFHTFMVAIRNVLLIYKFILVSFRG